MLKKIIGLVLLIIIAKLVLQQQEDKNTPEQNNKADKLQQAIASLQLAQEAEKAANDLLDDYNGLLPVHADKWKKTAELSQDVWPVFEQKLQNYGYTYANMYKQIEKWSSPVFHTGFYKDDFKPIIQQLKQRTTW